MNAVKKRAPTSKPPRVVRVRRGNLLDHEAYRRQVADATLSLYRTSGLGGVTMRAVGQRVGVSVMSLYRYFPSKSSLLMALWDSILADLYTQMVEAVGAQTTPRSRLRASEESFLTYFEEDADRFRIIFLTEQTVGADREAAIERCAAYQDLDTLSKRLHEEFARSLGAQPSPARFALARELRLTMAVGYLHSSLINKRGPWSDLAALRAAVVDTMLGAIEKCFVVDGVSTTRKRRAA